MNLYVVECGRYTYHVVAKSEEEAIKKTQDKYGLGHLSFTASPIDLEGYELVKGAKK